MYEYWPLFDPCLHSVTQEVYLAKIIIAYHNRLYLHKGEFSLNPGSKLIIFFDRRSHSGFPLRRTITMEAMVSYAAWGAPTTPDEDNNVFHMSWLMPVCVGLVGIGAQAAAQGRFQHAL